MQVQIVSFSNYNTDNEQTKGLQEWYEGGWRITHVTQTQHNVLFVLEKPNATT